MHLSLVLHNVSSSDLALAYHSDSLLAGLCRSLDQCKLPKVRPLNRLNLINIISPYLSYKNVC